jgi:hypothetical protein
MRKDRSIDIIPSSPAECIILEDDNNLGLSRKTTDLNCLFTLKQTGALCQVTFPLIKQLTIQTKLEVKIGIPLHLAERMHR